MSDIGARDMIRRASSSGFSLIELMIAMVIGLIILLAIYVVMMSSLRGLGTTEAQSALTDNGRRATSFIRQMLQQAGYRPLERTQLGFGFPERAGWETMQVVRGLATDASGNDGLEIRLWGSANGTVSDCLGADVADTEWIIISLAIVDNSLVCGHVRNDSSSVTNQIVVSAIERLRFRFSLLDEARYLRQNEIAAGRWDEIERVDFALLARSDSEMPRGDAVVNTRSYQVMDTTVTAPGDRFLRSIYHESVSVRNLILVGRQ
ncbi:MAG: PilW family protein [Gammaproteobacteria bacterium]|nr:PilW family protein [Gammaproteobacteria bacterium]